MAGREIVATTILMAALSFATVSLAQEPTAKERFNKGVELFKQEDYAGALAEFLAAYKVEPHFSVLYNIASCHASIENNAEALTYFQQYMDEGGDSIPTQRKLEVVEEMDRLKTLLCFLEVSVSPPYAETLVDGKTVQDASKTMYLDPGEHTIAVQMPGYVTVTESIVLTRGEPQYMEITLMPEATTGSVVVKSGVDDTYVSVDGMQVGPAPWEGSLPPGDHTITVKAMGFDDVSESVNVVVGETVMVKLDPTPVVKVAQTVPPVDTGKKEKPRSKKLAIGAGLTSALATVSWVGVVFFGLHAIKEKRNLDDCQDMSYWDCSSDEEESHIEEGEFSRMMANINLGLAIGFSILTITLAAASGASKKKEKQAQLVVSPYVQGPGELGLTLQGVF